MADFVVRGIERKKYARFRAVLVGRDETLGEWLERKMDEEMSWQADFEQRRERILADEAKG